MDIKKHRYHVQVMKGLAWGRYVASAQSWWLTKVEDVQKD